MKKELSQLDNILFAAFDLNISNIHKEEETGDYSGYNFRLGSLHVKYRKAKVTPKKIGQFVALWKRNTMGKTEIYRLKK